MRRFVVCLAVFALLLGLRLSDNGILGSGYKGQYSVWQKGGAVTTYAEEDLPFLTPFSAYATRLDFDGAKSDAFEAIKNMGGAIKWTEALTENLLVIYAYTPRILKSKTVNNVKINIMVAISGDKISMGSPILRGSY